MVKRSSFKNIGGSTYALIVLFVFSSLFIQNFLSFSNLNNVFRQGVVLSFVAIGQMFTILLKGINLSLGSIMGLTSVVTAVVMLQGVPMVPAILIGLLVATACGLIAGYLTAYNDIPAFISTFGMRGIAFGLALVISRERIISGFTENFRLIHYGTVFGIPITVVLIVVVYVLFHLILKQTSFGTSIYAIGGNEAAAELSGINVRLMKLIGYGLGGLMAGVGGLMMMARVYSARAVLGAGFEFESIAAVVLGGTMLSGGKGGVPQTIVGVLIIAILRNSMNLMGVATYTQLVVLGVIIVMAYLLDSLKLYLSNFRKMKLQGTRR